MVIALQSCGEMFDSVEKLSIYISHKSGLDFIQSIHGFQGVTELSIVGRPSLMPYPVKDEPSTMFKHLVRVFPQLIKLTFKIPLGNATLKQILESLRETRVLRELKSVRFFQASWEANTVGRDELLSLRDKINNEKVFRVEVEYRPVDSYDYFDISYSDEESDETPEEELGDLNLSDYEEGGD
ncbi:uncharacterized protein LOC115924970 [Strongylocentrotus purpuratus]|uniref:Uncharacterized protein n=1 Tax=Strongylocentrotus purpuratus TaxID=7668 RepID=A0A7M7NZJ8_STRPU|nr:uncharacterized protein LOC115924970 [Strongylocentrotus purpuratus]